MDQKSHNLRYREGESSMERTPMMESRVVGSQNGVEVSEEPEIKKFYDSLINSIWFLLILL